MYWILLAVLVSVVGLGIYRSRVKFSYKQRPKLSVNETVTFPIADFSGSSIEFADCACDAVKKLAGARFLAHETPSLPVAGCDRDECGCQYSHFKDRRASSVERRLEFETARAAEVAGGVERRRVGERRKFRK